MYKSKLVAVFYALSRAQQRQVRKLVQSPYFNKREDIIDLCTLMYQTPLENRTALRKEKVFPKIFGKQPFDVDQLDYTMSFLLKAIEEYLIHQEQTANKTSNQIALMKAYRKLGLQKHFNQAEARAHRLQKKNQLRDSYYYQHDFEIEIEQYHFLAEQQRNTSKNLQEVSAKLDLTFLIQKLKDACQLLAHQAVYKQKYDFGLLHAILPYIEENKQLLDDHPSIALYYYYYQAATHNEDESYFQAFKAVFLESTQVFESKELEDVYTMALNYCVRKVNVGQARYLEELFELYDAGLRLEILMEDGSLNPFKFNNIAKLALRLDKVDWTARFIEEYKSYVDQKYHDTYVHNAYSMLYFAQGKYEKTMTRLQQVNYKELFIALDARLLLTKVYYHLDEFMVLESHINSFKVFLRRKDILAYHREVYKNFINAVQRLITLAPFDKAGHKKLREDIQNTQKIAEKQWLLEQLRN